MSGIPKDIDFILRTLPPTPLVLIVGDPYTYPFHVGLELARRYFINYRWCIIVNDLIQRYLDLIRRNFNVVKDDIELIQGLCKGLESLTKALTISNNLAYVVINAFRVRCLSKYVSVLTGRQSYVNSATFIQVDETLSKPFTYLADLIVRLKVIEDISTLKTFSRIAKFITTRTYSEVVLNYSITSTGVIFEEVFRI